MTELEHLINISKYERAIFRSRMAALRSVRDQQIRMIKTSTPQERIDAEESVTCLREALWDV